MGEKGVKGKAYNGKLKSAAGEKNRYLGVFLSRNPVTRSGPGAPKIVF